MDIRVIRRATAEEMYGQDGKFCSLWLPQELVRYDRPCRLGANDESRPGPVLRLRWAMTRDSAGDLTNEMFGEVWTDYGDDGHVEYALTGFCLFELVVPSGVSSAEFFYRDFLSRNGGDLALELEHQLQDLEESANGPGA